MFKIYKDLKKEEINLIGLYIVLRILIHFEKFKKVIQKIFRILYESREKKLFCNTGDEEYPFYGTLDQLAEQLGEDFVRCHRSFLANRKKIERVYLSGNVIELKGNISLPLSRSYKPEVKKMLGFIAIDRSEAIN